MQVIFIYGLIFCLALLLTKSYYFSRRHPRYIACFEYLLENCLSSKSLRPYRYRWLCRRCLYMFQGIFIRRGYEEHSAMSAAIIGLTFGTLVLAFHGLYLWFSLWASFNLIIFALCFITATYSLVLNTSCSHHIWTTLEVALIAYGLYFAQTRHNYSVLLMMFLATLNRETGILLAVAVCALGLSFVKFGAALFIGWFLIYWILCGSFGPAKHVNSFRERMLINLNYKYLLQAVLDWAIYIGPCLILIICGWSKISFEAFNLLLVCGLSAVLFLCFTCWRETRPVLYIFLFPAIFDILR